MRMCKKCGQFITASRFETSDNSIWPSFIVSGFLFYCESYSICTKYILGSSLCMFMYHWRCNNGL